MPSEIIQTTREDLEFYAGWVLGLLTSYVVFGWLELHILTRLFAGLAIGTVFGLCGWVLAKRTIVV